MILFSVVHNIPHRLQVTFENAKGLAAPVTEDWLQDTCGRQKVGVRLMLCLERHTSIGIAIDHYVRSVPTWSCYQVPLTLFYEVKRTSMPSGACTTKTLFRRR